MRGHFSLADQFYMRQAIAVAQKGIERGQTPFGACIVKHGKLITVAHNQVWKRTDITAHAEVQAIRAACVSLKSIHLKDCVIYSTCEPCPMCFSACHWSGIKKIYYGAAIQDAHKAGFNELHISNKRMKKIGKSPVEIIGGLLVSENKQLLKSWSGHKAGKIY